MAISLVCFDLGRVLVKICDGWADAFARAGIVTFAMPDDPTLPATLTQKVHALELGMLSPASFVGDCATLIGCPRQDIAAMLDAYLCGPFPGAVELLDDLTKAGLAIACLSNTNQRHWEIMAGWPDPGAIFSRLAHRYASHELKLRKPDPAIYAVVEKHARPEEILFFDDLADNVEQACARGWQTVLVRSREDPVSEMRAVLVERGLLF